jgi:hypothetical protein
MMILPAFSEHLPSRFVWDGLLIAMQREDVDASGKRGNDAGDASVAVRFIGVNVARNRRGRIADVGTAKPRRAHAPACVGIDIDRAIG